MRKGSMIQFFDLKHAFTFFIWSHHDNDLFCTTHTLILGAVKIVGNVVIECYLQGYLQDLQPAFASARERQDLNMIRIIYSKDSQEGSKLESKGSR